MEPLDFMAAVLPPPGNGRYCVAELTKKKEHFYVEDLQDAQTKIETWNKNSYDIYFALGTFGTENKRVQTNVQNVKCIAIDVDCNHPKDIPDSEGKIRPKAYASAQEAVNAIMAFADDVGLSDLGAPWLVASGGGVHAYWPFTQTQAVADWKPVAEGFKRLCFQKKLDIDQTVTADASRVLRVPGTVNTGVKSKGKQVREQTNVRFKNEGDFFEFEDIKALVERNLVGTAYEVMKPRPASLVLPGAALGGETSVKLFENSQTSFGKIIKITALGEGCGQIAHYLENAEDDGMEPLWRGLLSIAQKCVDHEKATVWLSQKHPYDLDRMNKKLSEIKGPYPCTKLDSENPGVCPSCKHWGNITNPLALGREYAVSHEEKIVEIKEITDGKEEIKTVKRPEPPKGYAYGERGGVFMEKEDEDANGNKIKRQVMLLPYDLFPVDILNSAGDHTVHMLATRPQGVQTVTFAQEAIVTKEAIVKALASQNIVAAFGSGNDKNLADYIRACVEKMSTEKTPINVPASYGWQKDDTFVFAGKIYANKAHPTPVPMPGLENIVANTKPTGTLEGWRNFINLLIRKKMYGHLSIILAGASAPLMRFTGMYGLTYHCGSTESGTGKSLALEGAASIWGHPVHYRTGKGTSPVAMQQRLGLLNTTPLITDEITSKNRKDFEWFPEFLLDMTEGRGKERMESGSNKERINLSTWMTNAIMSSNTHVVDILTGERKHAAEGELRRLIEFVMDEELSWEAEEIEIIKTLSNNYAVAGDLLVQYMVDNIAFLKKLVPDCVSKMYTEFKATNDERFWMAGIGAQVAAAIILNKQHADIIDLPIDEIIKDMHQRLYYMRTNVHGGKRTAEDVLNAFIREYWGHFVIVNYGEKGGLSAAMGDGSIIDKATTKSDVMGRVENGVTSGCKDFFIEERLLKSFCSSMSFGYSDFKRQMEQKNAVSYVTRKDMMARTTGPQMRVSAMKISRREEEADEIIALALPLAKA
jgi:uncharacterized protein (DUF927 family)